MRDIISGLLSGIGIVLFLISIGIYIGRYVETNRFYKNCTSEKEFLLGKTIVQCTIIKDLR